MKPRKSIIDPTGLYSEKGKQIEKLPPSLNIGIFGNFAEGMNILANVLNRQLSPTGVRKLMLKAGVEKGSSTANIASHVRRIKKAIKYDKEKFYVPFLTTGTATRYLATIENEYDNLMAKGVVDKERNDKLYTKVDPILGLHAIILEIEGFIEAQALDFKQYTKLWEIKASTYEKIHKLDNESRNKIDRLKILQGFDKLAKFIEIIHEELQNMLIDIKPLLDEVENSIVDVTIKQKIVRVVNEIEQSINIKERYLQYADTINVSGEDVNSITESDDLE